MAKRNKSSGLRDQVENFNNQLNDYKAVDGNFGNSAPDENSFANNVVGSRVYNTRKNAYEYDSGEGGINEFQAIQLKQGYETPEEYSTFLEQSDERALEAHNEYMTRMAGKLNGIFDEGKCSVANTEYSTLIGGGSVNFCTGDVTEDELNALIDAYAAQIEGQVLAGEDAETANQEAWEGADSLRIGDIQLGASVEEQTAQTNAALETAGENTEAIIDKLDEYQQLAADAQELGRISQIKFAEQCFLLTHVKTLAELKFALDVRGVEAQGATIVNKTLPYNGGSDFGVGVNSSILAHYDPFAFLNRLTQSSNKDYFFQIPNSSLSALQPMIRLFKVIAETNDQGQTVEREVEIKFDSHYSQKDVQDLLSNINVRGHGVGVRSFDFAYEANNPFAIKKSISAKLVIFANSFRELYRDREGEDTFGNASTYKYLDLALKTGDQETFAYQKGGAVDPQENSTATYDAEKLNFRLKAVVGYANPAANGVGTGTINSSLLNAVYDSYITLNLTPTIHDFDIDELGRVTFTLNYLAYAEDFFDQAQYNIFSDTESVYRQIKRKIQYTEANVKCNSEDAAKLKNDENEIKAIEEDKKQNLRSLINRLMNTNKLRILDINIQELNKYRAGGPLLEIDPQVLEDYINKYVKVLEDDSTIYDLIQEETPQSSDAIEPDDSQSVNEQLASAYAQGTQSTQSYTTQIESGRANSAPPKQTFGNIPFFYVSDLIDVILAGQTELFRVAPGDLEEELADADQELAREQINSYRRYGENFSRYRVVLGPVELVKATKSGIQTSIVSLGDLPVSVKYFMEFMTEKMLKTDKVQYPLASFLNQFFNSLIRDFLNSDKCYGGRSKQRVRLFQSAITAFNNHSDDSPDDLTWYMKQTGINRVDLYDSRVLTPALDVMGGRGEATQTGDITNEVNYLVYYAGRVMPMENLAGDKEEDHAKGVWHYQIGKDSGITKTINLSKTNSPGQAEVRFEQEGYDGLQQLLVLYDANIKTYLDVTAFPGNYIYIEPRGFDTGITDPKLFTSLGVGGYYMITRSEHALGPGKAESSITAKWVAQIDKEKEIADEQEIAETEQERCAKIKAERAANQDLGNMAGKMLLSGLTDFVGSLFSSDNGTTGSPGNVTGND
jgi:hypothetical protein